MTKTSIDWAEYVWNPVTGCTKVSEGCRNCYAERMSKRLAGRCGYPADEPFRVTLHSDKIGEPLRWKKPRRIFVNSMSDLFHEDVPDEFIARIWWAMGQCAGYLDPSRYRGHTFMILTKRPKRMKNWLDGWRDQETRKRWVESFGEVFDWMNGPRYWPDVLDNVWLGVSVENQAVADERIPLLLQTPAAARFISAEPLLGPVNLDKYIGLYDCMRCGYRGSDAEIEADSEDMICPECEAPDGEFGFAGNNPYMESLDWVIVGGESGPGARPMHPDWVRSLRDQAETAEVPFFFKSWGDVQQCNWEGKFFGAPYPDGQCIDGYMWDLDSYDEETGLLSKGGDELCPVCKGKGYVRVDKKKAGRMLDNRTWDEIPTL